MNEMIIRPVSLQGDHIQMVPLSEAYVPGLAVVGQDRIIWRYMIYGELTDEKKMLEHVRILLGRAKQGTDLPFVVIHNQSGQPIGCTRYLEIRPEHRRLEIGGTWFGLAFQRTKANTESKFLLLKHAFETLGCVRVQFKTSTKNERSQKALERIGARREGVLRNHMILPDGELRDSIYYSILPDEWPAVKGMLEEKLSRKY
jgi:RimJ/RimL family protein N-acetyltransferase